MVLKVVAEQRDNGTHPFRNRTLGERLFGGVAQLIQIITFRLQGTLQRRIPGDQADLRLEIAVDTSLAEVGGADQREVGQVGVGKVVPGIEESNTIYGVIIIQFNRVTNAFFFYSHKKPFKT